MMMMSWGFRASVVVGAQDQINTKFAANTRTRKKRKASNIDNAYIIMP